MSNKRIISYTTLDRPKRANWAAVTGFALALLLPTVYFLYPMSFSTFGTSTHVKRLSVAVWVVSGGLASLVSAWGLYKAKFRGGRWWGIALAGLLLGLLNAAAFPFLQRHVTERVRRDSALGHKIVECEWRLHMIATAIESFTMDHDGRYPDRLEDLLDNYFKRGSSLRCPFDARPTTTDSVSTYVYLARGCTVDVDRGFVLLYEPLASHPSNIRYVRFLFADGRVESVSKAKAEKLIQQLENGINPPKQ